MVVFDSFNKGSFVINQRFGKWIVLEEVRVPGQQSKNYKCKCDCGNIFIRLGFTLRRGTSTQCVECYRKSGHGKAKTRTYNIWSGLFTRCNNYNSATYQYYGGRGIKVDDRWNRFEDFFIDMGESPEGHQLDRIDPLGNYCKENCRWVTKDFNMKRQRTRHKDITGQTFGSWTIIERDRTKPTDHAYYVCRCICGTVATRITSFLVRGKNPMCINCKNIAHRGWGKRYKEKILLSQKKIV